MNSTRTHKNPKCYPPNKKGSKYKVKTKRNESGGGQFHRVGGFNYLFSGIHWTVAENQ